MPLPTTYFAFGEWLPDQPGLVGSYLSVANNVIPQDGYYAPFSQPATASANFTMPAAARGMLLAHGTPGTTTENVFYVGTTDHLYMNDLVTNNMTAKSAAITTLDTAFSVDWEFAQFDSYVIAAQLNTVPLVHTLGATTNFLTLAATGTAPAARTVGVVNRFAVLGDIIETVAATRQPYAIQWSSIDNVRDWPTPGGASATASQSGIQYLNPSYGPIVKIVSGDQFGLVMQSYGISRMTYVGSPVVFQFDSISNIVGLRHRQGVIRVGNLIYFVSWDGFYATDGVTVTNIGVGKVNKTFLAELTASGDQYVRCAYSSTTNCIYWCFNTSGEYSTVVYIYHISSGRFSRGTTASLASLVSFPGTDPYAYDSSNVLRQFNGANTSAQISTTEMELNTGGRALIDQIKPNIEHTTTPSVFASVSFRDTLYTTPTESATLSPTYSALGFIDLRNAVRPSGKYLKLNVYLKSNFTKAAGCEYRAITWGTR